MQEREEPLPGLLYEARVRQPGLQQQLYPPQYLQEEHTPSGALVVRISTNAEEIRQQQAHHPSQQEGSVSSSASSHTSTSLKNSPLNVIPSVATKEEDIEAQVRQHSTNSRQNLVSRQSSGGRPVTDDVEIVREESQRQIPTNSVDLQRASSAASAQQEEQVRQSTGVSTQHQSRISFVTDTPKAQKRVPTEQEKQEIMQRHFQKQLQLKERQELQEQQEQPFVLTEQEQSEIMERYYQNQQQQYQLQREQQQQQQEQQTQLPFFDQTADDRTIKLGLGDFVFYSILCARAALVSFTTFIAVFIVVLFGLAITLILLAVYRTALPALPISILLGLCFFFATDAAVVPFVTNFGFQIAYS